MQMLSFSVLVSLAFPPSGNIYERVINVEDRAAHCRIADDAIIVRAVEVSHAACKDEFR